jgi:predicted Zn-dependent protease
MNIVHTWLWLLLTAAPPPPAPAPSAFASGQAEFQKALTAEDADDLSGARAHLEQAVKLSPSLGLARVELADVILKQGEEGAPLLAALNDAQKVEPENPRLWRIWGAYREGQNDAAGAISAYEKAIALKGDVAQPHFRLAVLYAAAQRTDDALAQYRAALLIEPNNQAARLGVADQLIAKNDLEGAETELALLSSANPSNALYQKRLDEVRAKQGKGALQKLEPIKKKMRPLKKSTY